MDEEDSVVAEEDEERLEVVVVLVADVEVVDEVEEAAVDSVVEEVEVDEAAVVDDGNRFTENVTNIHYFKGNTICFLQIEK